MLNFSDCDDNNETVYPGAREVCDGLDNNCDGFTDNGIELIVQYLDNDGDGFGNPQEGIENCNLLDGYVLTPGDCNDEDVNINPDAPDSCDGLDNNCNGEADEVGCFTVTGIVWNDTDGNRNLDNGEFGIPNVRVKLIQVGRNLLELSGITEADGRYIFENIPAGDYVIQINNADISDNNIIFTSDEDMVFPEESEYTEISIQVNGDDLEVNPVSTYQSATISGVYYDLEAQEPRTGNLLLFNADNPEEPIESIFITDGIFSFEDLPVGNYYIEIESGEGESFLISDDMNESNIISQRHDAFQNFNIGTSEIFEIMPGSSVTITVIISGQTSVLSLDQIYLIGQWEQDQQQVELEFSYSEFEDYNELALLRSDNFDGDFEEIKLMVSKSNSTGLIYDNDIIESGIYYYMLEGRNTIDGRIKKSNLASVEVDIQFTASITVQPNPARDYIDISILGDQGFNDLTIYTGTGELMEHIVLTQDSKIYSLSLNNYPAGHYLVRMTNGLDIKTTKFVVIK